MKDAPGRWPAIVSRIAGWIMNRTACPNYAQVAWARRNEGLKSARSVTTKALVFDQSGKFSGGALNRGINRQGEAQKEKAGLKNSPAEGEQKPRGRSAEQDHDHRAADTNLDARPRPELQNDTFSFQRN